MRNTLIIELIRFAWAKKSARERLRYSVLSLVFYPFLAKARSADTKDREANSTSQVGDDIYPLF